MKRILTLILVAAVFSSCGRKIYKPVEVYKTDSVVVHNTIVERDTVIVAPSDGVQTEIPLADIRHGMKPVQKQSKQAKVGVKVSNNRLKIDCECDTVAIKAQLKDQIQSKERTITKTEIQQVRYVPWYYKVAAVLGLLWLINVAFYLIKILSKTK